MTAGDEAGFPNKYVNFCSTASERILYSYKRSLNGFAARLTEQEAQKLSSVDGVVSVLSSRKLEPLTTRSWDFLGFPRTPPEALPLQGNVIVGMLDYGLWPDSPSFSDEGFGPPPSRWKGACQNFTCNNKIIGARAYRSGATGLSPVNELGHGSHTASTVVGREVGGVSLGRLATLAIYKVCWGEKACDELDILAAFDDAIADGVDVISFSIGSDSPRPYWEDAAAIGSFHAMRRGVLTSAGAGNSGWNGGHDCNVAPWMLSVAASSIDRTFVDRIVLGNGKTVVGTSINTFPTLANATLVFPTNGSCDPDDLAGGSSDYKGKIVLCPNQNAKILDSSYIGSGPFRAGAAGAVIVEKLPGVPLDVPLPALMVSQDLFNEILDYVSSTSHPVGTIDSTETTVDLQAPIVASFSSPGPNLITPGILKPDLSAPGVDIIASWSPRGTPSGDPNDKRSVLYSIQSGTSMACPHASGAAAYVKSFHRDWSPAMIMSALITTATPMNTSGNAGSNELNYGAGQLNPAKARDPGLVYDASEGDYVAMLCAQGYNASQLALITGGSKDTACPGGSTPTAGSVGDLNYPTMAAHSTPGPSFSLNFSRTATNVGDAPDAVYEVDVSVPVTDAFLDVTVVPSRLEFSARVKTASYKVYVSGVAPPAVDDVISMAVLWSDGEHTVRSPLVVYTTDVDTPAMMNRRQQVSEPEKQQVSPKSEK